MFHTEDPLPGAIQGGGQQIFLVKTQLVDCTTAVVPTDMVGPALPDFGLLENAVKSTGELHPRLNTGLRPGSPKVVLAPYSPSRLLHLRLCHFRWLAGTLAAGTDRLAKVNKLSQG